MLIPIMRYTALQEAHKTIFILVFLTNYKKQHPLFLLEM